MKNRKYSVLFGMAVAGLMLLASCQDILQAPANSQAAKKGYGLVSITTTGGGAERTALPPDNIFTNYEYAFEKDGSPMDPDPEADEYGCFELPAGTGYTVTVKAQIGAEAPYLTVAEGTSDAFEVVADKATPVEVKLDPLAAGNGKFAKRQ